MIFRILTKSQAQIIAYFSALTKFVLCVVVDYLCFFCHYLKTVWLKRFEKRQLKANNATAILIEFNGRCFDALQRHHNNNH